SDVKLFIKDILNLKAILYTGGLKLICGFFYHSHPVNKVELVATIVGIVKHEQRIIFTLDDASARIECINFGNDGEDYTNKPEFDLGTIVKELFRWLEIIKLQKGVYSKPFVLPNHAAIDNVNYTEEPPLIPKKKSDKEMCRIFEKMEYFNEPSLQITEDVFTDLMACHIYKKTYPNSV
ncbi:170_t:CDS:2, partial [Gigaspora rosea]